MHLHGWIMYSKVKLFSIFGWRRLQLFDYCPSSDGASALVIAEAGKEKDLIKKSRLFCRGQAPNGFLYVQKDLIRIRAESFAFSPAVAVAAEDWRIPNEKRCIPPIGP